MVQKSLIATVLTLVFTITTSTADEREDGLKEGSSIASNLDKILHERNLGQYRKLYPQFLETMALRFYRQNELAKEKNQLIDRWQMNDVRDAVGDMEDSFSRFLSDWLRREEMKRKRAHHRALCHFKICNMGSKRSYSWDVWPNDNQPASVSNF